MNGTILYAAGEVQGSIFGSTYSGPGRAFLASFETNSGSNLSFAATPGNTHERSQKILLSPAYGATLILQGGPSNYGNTPFFPFFADCDDFLKIDDDRWRQ
jgi:hypothetical protein